MAWLALLVALPFLVLISLSVFGGGQIFMPIFSWFWGLFREWFGSNITESDISQVFAVGNATPGILSTKFALVTGYFYANKEWWRIYSYVFNLFSLCYSTNFNDEISNEIFKKIWK